MPLEQVVEMAEHNDQPLIQMEEFMRDTALYRARWVRENSGKSVHDVLQEFPQLTNPGMIAQDFQAIHPDSAMRTWTPELEEKVLNLAPIKRKLQVSTDGLGQDEDPPEGPDLIRLDGWEHVPNFCHCKRTPPPTTESQAWFSSYNSRALTPDFNRGQTKTFLAVKILPALVPNSVYRVGRRTLRHSVEEARGAFLDVQPIGMNMVDYLLDAGAARAYPYILILGDNCSQAFVVFAGKALEQRTLLGAVDICFKIFYVFDIKYPKQCAHVWELFQTLYKMEGGFGSIAPAVSFLDSQLSI
ncbi:unnamed protein product [Arctogadus glacialis]